MFVDNATLTIGASKWLWLHQAKQLLLQYSGVAVETFAAGMPDATFARWCINCFCSPCSPKSSCFLHSIRLIVVYSMMDWNLEELLPFVRLCCVGISSANPEHIRRRFPRCYRFNNICRGRRCSYRRITELVFEPLSSKTMVLSWGRHGDSHDAGLQRNAADLVMMGGFWRGRVWGVAQ